MDIEGLTNLHGFMLIDEHQRKRPFENICGVGVCVAIPPLGATPVPTGAAKTEPYYEKLVLQMVGAKRLKGN